MQRQLLILSHILLVKGSAWPTTHTAHTTHNPQPTRTAYYMSILHQTDMYSQHHNTTQYAKIIYIVETPNNTTRLDNIGWLKREKIATSAK